MAKNIPSYQEVLRLLNDKKMTVIRKMYQMRYLSYNQIMQITYEGQSTNVTQEKKATTRLINELIHYQCIEPIELDNDITAYSLKMRGVDALIDKGYLESEIFDLEKGEVVRGYLRPHELEMSEHMLPHQLHLNQFALDFEGNVKKLNPSLSYEYLDEKDVTKTYMFKSDRVDPKRPYVVDYSIKPDGLIRLDDMDIIIELDMGTETTKALEKKWSKYHNYFISTRGRERKRPLYVIFVLSETRSKSKRRFDNRKKIVWNSISNSISQLSEPSFDISVGTHQEMLDYVTQRFITGEWEQKRQQFQKELMAKYPMKIFSYDQINQLNKKYEYDYILSLYEADRQKALQVDNRFYRFLVRENYHDSFKTMLNISEHYYFQHEIGIKLSEKTLQKRGNAEKLSEEQRKAFVRAYLKKMEFYQLVITDDLPTLLLKHQLYGNLKDFQRAERRSSKIADGIYYTTPDLLLNVREFYQALFSFDEQGHMVFYTDARLIEVAKRISVEEFTRLTNEERE